LRPFLDNDMLVKTILGEAGVTTLGAQLKIMTTLKAIRDRPSYGAADHDEAKCTAPRCVSLSGDV